MYFFYYYFFQNIFFYSYQNHYEIDNLHQKGISYITSYRGNIILKWDLELLWDIERFWKISSVVVSYEVDRREKPIAQQHQC